MSGFMHAWAELPKESHDLDAGDSIPHHGACSLAGSARCAHCASVRLRRDDTAGRICALLGAIAGGISGGVKALGVARSCVGSISDPRLHGAALVSAFTLGVLAGAATGCAAGAALGQRLDVQVMLGYLCLDCGHKFSG